MITFTIRAKKEFDGTFTGIVTLTPETIPFFFISYNHVHPTSARSACRKAVNEYIATRPRLMARVIVAY